MKRKRIPAPPDLPSGAEDRRRWTGCNALAPRRLSRHSSWIDVGPVVAYTVEEIIIKAELILKPKRRLRL